MIYDFFIHCSAFQILRYPGITTADLKKFISALRDVHPQVLTRLDIDGKLTICLIKEHILMLPSRSIGQYDAHLARQQADLRAFSEDESLLLDPTMEYSDIVGLSAEVAERLYRVKPTTIVRLCMITSLL